MQYEDRLPFNMFQLSTPNSWYCRSELIGPRFTNISLVIWSLQCPKSRISWCWDGVPPDLPWPGPWRPRRSDVDEPFRRFLQIWLEVMSECSAAPWPGGSGFGVGEATWEPCNERYMGGG